jgi:cytochrome P450
LHLDPPEHTRSKRLLATAFVPERVERYRDSIRETVIELLDGLREHKVMDISYDFARLVPTSVVAQLVGCPEDTERFTEWVEGILEQAATNPEEAAGVALDMFTFLSEVVQQRRAEPGDDIISLLAEAEIDGDRLEDEEIVFTAVLLVLAGIDTAWSTLCSSILHLATHPADQQRLREDPGLIPSAREEFLRAYAPVTVGRMVSVDTTFRGAELKAGEMVLVSFPSANRDESVFEDADTVKLDRERNRHLAFGSGIHRCLGVNIARMELTIALEEVLRRIPPFVLADDELDWTAGQVRGAKHVRIKVAEG